MGNNNNDNVCDVHIKRREEKSQSSGSGSGAQIRGSEKNNRKQNTVITALKQLAMQITSHIHTHTHTYSLLLCITKLIRPMENEAD